jgi:F-type H+-transporting ATPase subunit c
VFSGALQAMGRNPEAEGMLRTYMFLGFALAEVPFILSMVFGLLIGFKII